MDLLSTEDKYHMTQLLGGRAGILTQACSNLAATSLKKKISITNVQFLYVWVCLCMFVCGGACTCVCAHVHIWKPEADFRHPPQFLCTVFFVTCSLSSHRAS